MERVGGERREKPVKNAYVPESQQDEEKQNEKVRMSLTLCMYNTPYYALSGIPRDLYPRSREPPLTAPHEPG